MLARVAQSIQQSHSQTLRPKNLPPLAEGQVAIHDDTPLLVPFAGSLK